mmetsp:Transcript_23621/g.93298  ORF Transcript_23621/g.93298 Transcript_23621/m.93298 type:complete len:90 (+) Transcript_23621:175-444(+)
MWGLGKTQQHRERQRRETSGSCVFYRDSDNFDIGQVQRCRSSNAGNASAARRTSERKLREGTSTWRAPPELQQPSSFDVQVRALNDNHT